MSLSSSEAIWFIHSRGEPYGPLSKDDIESHVADGNVDKTTPVWREGWDAWHPIDEVEDLVSLFAPSGVSSSSETETVIWHLVEGDKSVGPFSTADLVGKISSGEVGPDRWVLKDGWEKWRKITEAEEFRGHFPPKIPSSFATGNQTGPAVLKKTKWKQVAGVVAGLIVLLWMFSGGDDPATNRQSPEDGFMEVAREADRFMRDQSGKTCPRCKGSGKGGSTISDWNCGNCNGRGTKTTPSGYAVVCSTCGGSGRRPAPPCEVCGGTGVYVYGGGGR